MVLEGLENYSAERLAGPLGLELVGQVDDIAIRQCSLKQFVAAEGSYRKALRILGANEILDAQQRRHGSAGIYHQLGLVAQDQRQWAQAEQYYHKALEMYAEFNDRYEQAGTYHQLGGVAWEEQQWPQAKQHLLKSLALFAEIQDNRNGGIALQNLARLWRESGDDAIVAGVAEVLNISADEAEKLLQAGHQNA